MYVYLDRFRVIKEQAVAGKFSLGVGSFTNYVYKKKWVDSQKMSTFIR